MTDESPAISKIQQTVDALQYTVDRLEQTMMTMLHFAQTKFTEHDKRFDILEVQNEKTQTQIKQLGEQMNWRMDQIHDGVRDDRITLLDHDRRITKIEEK